MSLEREDIKLSDLDEINHQVWTVIKKLEESGWHPYVQRCVKLYIDSATKGNRIVDIDKNGKESNSRSAFKYLHKELNKELFRYQDTLNTVCRNQGYSLSLRKKILIFLGCKCLNCGLEDVYYLQLDHKKDDGGKERRESKKHGINLWLYYWNNLVDAYLNLQVLCGKCNNMKLTNRILQDDIDDKVNKELKQKKIDRLLEDYKKTTDKDYQARLVHELNELKKQK